MFTRRHLNIESLTVSESSIKGIPSYIIVVVVAEEMEEQARAWGMGVATTVGNLGSIIGMLTYASISVRPRKLRHRQPISQDVEREIHAGEYIVLKEYDEIMKRETNSERGSKI